MGILSHSQGVSQPSDTIQTFYQEPYQQLVQPSQIWPVSKYFLRHWMGCFKPAEMWLIIAARQFSYLNHKSGWFHAYDETLAKATGLNTQTYRGLRRTLNDTLLGHFLQAETENRTYSKKNGRLRPTATRYTIRLDDPLTPNHALAVAHWLQQNAPQQLTGESLNALLQTALGAADLLTNNPENAIQLPTNTLYTVSDLIPYLFGQECLKSKQVWGKTAVRLQHHITQPDQIHIESQYFRRQWLPKLSPEPALLLVYLRSYCYVNEETQERRDSVQIPTGDLEQVFGISSRTLRRWVQKIQEATGDKNPSGSFFRSIKQNKRSLQTCSTCYELTMHIPLVPEDVAPYSQLASCETSMQKPPVKRQTAVSQQALSVKQDNRDLDTAFYKQEDVTKTTYAEQATHHEQITHHAHTITDKMCRTDVAVLTKKAPPQESYGQNTQGSWTNNAPSKDSKALIRSIKEIIDNNKQNRGGYQGPSFAVVAVKNLSGLLTQLEITGQARQFFQESHLTLEQMVGWYLWASHQPWCKQPVAYTIQRVRHHEPPPKLYERFATLSWQEWQQYAILCHLELAEPKLSGLFDAWCEYFNQTAITQLPFGVGQGLDAVVAMIEAEIDAVADESTKTQEPLEASLELEQNGRFPASLKPASLQDLTVWQQTLQEVSPQMTKATFNAYVQGAKLIGVEPLHDERDEVVGEGSNGRFVVQLRNRYAKEWVDNRLAPTILRTWSAIAGYPVQARFSL